MHSKNELVLLNESTTFYHYLVMHSRFSSYTIDGRFLFFSSCNELQIIDILHSKIRFFNYHFSQTVNVDGRPQKLKSKPLIHGFYPVNLNTIIMYIKNKCSTTYSLGVGRVDYNHSIVIVEQMVSTVTKTVYSWMPLTFPPNLKDGIFCHAYSQQNTIVLIQLGDDGQLRQTDFVHNLEVIKPFVVMGDYVCGFSYRWSNDGEVNGMNLEKTNLLTGKKIQQSTNNWETVKEIGEKSMVIYNETILLGKRLFKYFYSKSSDKSYVFSLNTDTLKWKKMITLKGSINSITSDGIQTLIVRMEPKTFNLSAIKFYRFVFEVEKLSTMAWYQLKKIFDARPEAYDFILNNVPAKFRYTPL